MFIYVLRTRPLNVCFKRCFMKKLKEFLFMFIPYCFLCVLLIFYAYDFAPLKNGFIITKFIYDITHSYYFAVLMYGVIYPVLVSLFITLLFAFNFKIKKETKGKIINRKKYYLLLFLIALIAPVGFNCMLFFTLIDSVLLSFIHTLQAAIIVVFIHWIFECIIKKIKS